MGPCNGFGSLEKDETRLGAKVDFLREKDCRRQKERRKRNAGYRPTRDLREG